MITSTRSALLYISILILLISSPLSAQKWIDTSLDTDTRIETLIAAMTLEEKCSQLLHESDSIPRLGIPQYNWWSEALHGVARSGKATVFPQAIGLAAAFDPAMMKEIGTAISDEARAINNDLRTSGKPYIRYMGLTFWSPNVNIFRDPRWGRGQETYGEDPFLTGTLGASFIKGLQGNDPKYLKVGACAKHFVVHSGPEALRHEFNARVNSKDLYETYLPAFKSCVDAGVEAVMCAYNRTNDEPCCGSKFLLQDILRDEWGFQGHILSDCWALLDFHEGHKVTANPVESAALALKKGVNLNCGVTYNHLSQAVKQGLITEDEIDARLAILLRTRFKLGLFDPVEDCPYTKIPTSVIHSEKHQQLARKAAQKSIVLLQNKNNVLPLRKDLGFVYLSGPFAGDVLSLVGNYNGVSDNMVTLLEGVTSKLSPSTRIQYRPGALVNASNSNPIDWYSEQASLADATIVALGLTLRIEGEEGEAIASQFKGDNLSMSLPENQLNLLRKLRGKHTKPIIAVIFAGSPVDLREVSQLADAIVYAWYPGEQGGQAIADIIFGDAIPSGRLPITFPKSIDQLPPYDDYSMVGRTYRYMEDEPMFAVGFVLSFCQYNYNKIDTYENGLTGDEPLHVSVNITNTGKYAAEEVVQLYVRRRNAGVDEPLIKLVGFARKTLPAGKTENVFLRVEYESLKTIDEKGNGVLIPGEYELYAGGASPSERSTALGAANGVWMTFRIK